MNVSRATCLHLKIIANNGELTDLWMLRVMYHQCFVSGADALLSDQLSGTDW